MIRASAVISILGSLFVLLCAGIMAFGAAFSPAPPDQPLSPKAFTIILAAMAVFFAASSGWGIATAIALFRRKPWARVSILIFAGILAIMGGSGLLMVPFMQLPTDPNVNARAVTFIKLGMGGFYAVLTGLGVWWLVLFNLRSSQAYFAGEPAPASGRPLSVSLIAGYFFLGVAMLPVAALMRIPVILFGVFVPWPAALALYTVFLAVHLYLGLFLLRLDESARLGAIAYFGIIALSGFVTLARVDYADMVRRIQDSMPIFLPNSAPQPAVTPVWAVVVFTLVYTVAPIWFLVRRRSAFNPAASQPS